MSVRKPADLGIAELSTLAFLESLILLIFRTVTPKNNQLKLTIPFLCSWYVKRALVFFWLAQSSDAGAPAVPGRPAGVWEREPQTQTPAGTVAAEGLERKALATVIRFGKLLWDL